MSRSRQLCVLLGGIGFAFSFGGGCGGSSHDASDQGGSPGPGVQAPQANPGTTSNTPNTPHTNAGDGTAGGAGTSMPLGGSAAPPEAGTMEPVGAPLALDDCGLNTRYAGDQYCILPPPPDKGFQVHIGPSNYDNPEPQYMLGPGQEETTTFSAVSGNDKPVYFYYRQFRMRPVGHHNIVSSGSGGGFDMGRRIATFNNLAEDTPKGGIIAPENKGVGIAIEPATPLTVQMHVINTTDEPLLREIWVNFWYRDVAEITEPVVQMFEPGSTTFAVQPGQDTILGPYTCLVGAKGRMLWLYGHRHANNVRFTAWRMRGQQRDVFYDANNWEEPLLLEYSSTVQNPVPDIENGIEGGWSGVLDFEPGDQIQWECHVINRTDGILRFTNNAFSGEMCIMDAEMIGIRCQ